jgi:hypothetical protein
MNLFFYFKWIRKKIPRTQREFAVFLRLNFFVLPIKDLTYSIKRFNLLHKLPLLKIKDNGEHLSLISVLCRKD